MYRWMFSNFQWFPPAETKIPIRVLANCFKENSLAAKHALCAETKSLNCLFGPSGRALLCRLLSFLFDGAEKQRNEVLIPAYTCYSVAAAIVKAGLKIRIYDIAYGSFNPKMDSLAKNFTSKTLAVISQHLMGSPTEIEKVAEVAAANNSIHIEDAAQALGGRLNNISLGSYGDYGLFSFGRGKPLPLGGGGAVISKVPGGGELPTDFAYGTGLKKLAVSALSQAIAHPFVYGIAEKLPLGLGRTEFEPHFQIADIPRTLISMLGPMMSHLTEMNHHRRRIAAVYKRLIPQRHLIVHVDEATPVYPRFPVLARSEHLPAEFIRLGIRRLYPNSLNREGRIIPHILNADQSFSGAERLAQQLISLPTHYAIDVTLAEFIGHKVKRWLAV